MRTFLLFGALLFGMAAHPTAPVPRTAALKAHGTPPPATPAPATPAPHLSRIAQRPALPERLLATFRPMVGIREQPLGSNRGPEVDRFNRSANTALGSPWCASVAHFGYEQNGIPGRGAYSPSWFSKSRVIPSAGVQPGDIGLVYFPAKGRYAHVVACVEAVRRNPAGRVTEVVTLEGNTNAQGSREGDQFARRIRAADTLTFVRWW